MIQRQQKLTSASSLLLFGARGVGKSTLVSRRFSEQETLVIHLLDPQEEAFYSEAPDRLMHVVDSLPETVTTIVIDEIQKLPKLLDVVHLLIEKPGFNKRFVMTGSSARKLRAQGVNLLAGRAFVYSLYPFTHKELAKQFSLNEALSFGLLPRVYEFDGQLEKRIFLESYANTYLKEEVWAEHLIKNLQPFRRFLEVAAQSNGKIVNYAKIARDVGVDEKTVKSYFSILEDTLVAVMLEPYRRSFRRRLRVAPKFFFFDLGVVRALSGMLQAPIKPKTSYYGALFECFIFMECVKLNAYHHLGYQFSYLMTMSGAEIDLVIERPGQSVLLVEISSSDQVGEASLKTLKNLSENFENAELICLSQERRKREVGLITLYPWQQFFDVYFSA